TSKNDITVYGQVEAVISDFYTLTGNIIFSDLKPGLYQLSVKYGEEIIISETINVKTYIKPVYRLILTSDKKAVFAGETITYKVKAEFFEGTPVSNLKLKYNGYLDRQISGEVQLNQNGEGSFAVKTDYQERQYSYWPRYFGLTVSPAVAEEGEITANTSVLVFGPHIDLRSEQTISERTSRFNLNLRNVVLEKVQKGEPWWVSDNYLGDPVARWNVTADVTEIIYHKRQVGTGYDIINKTTYPIYQYSTEERSIRQDVLTTDGAGNARYEWTAEEGKTYCITFTAKDATGRQVRQKHYVYGGQFSYFGFYDGRGAILKNLNEGKKKYKLGDAISLQMQDIGGNTLESGSGRFVFVRIVNGIVSYQISDSANYTDTFKDSYIPNVQIMGVWFSGSRFIVGFPGWYSQGVNLSFDSDGRRLNIEVIKDKDRYRPRDKVNLSIRVTDKNGNPKQAEVNIAGIDEAVFSLNPLEKDITNLLYQDLFPLLEIRSSHLIPFESTAEGGGCFAAGTMIWTPQAERPIEELRVGDEILTRKSESSPEIVKTQIKQIGSYLVDGYLVINGNLRLTPNHKLFVNGFWKRAGEIKIGDRFIAKNGVAAEVISVEFVPEWGLVYNIELENYHTYFADGVYVHNEEKGAGIERADFRDLAIYQSVRTDAEGRAQVSFDVPDNLTSWRITAQAITKDLFAGKTVDFVPVGLPFFVETALNRTYLVGDNLTLRARVFGTANVQSNITYTVESKTLPFGKIKRTGGNVVEIPLGPLSAGRHQIKISARSGNYNDTIVRDIDVLTSYFSQNTAEFYELSPNLMNIQGAAKGYTTLLFSSYERGRFYNVLRRLSYQSGPRLDQKFAAVLAKAYLNRFFDEINEIEDVNTLNYQYQGGATLLPYSDSDLELSAKFANLIQGEPVTTDSESLKKYLYSSLSDRKTDLSRISAALYGLSAFKEPVLVIIQNIKTDPHLTLKDKIYLTLALDNLGAKEEARAYYRAEIKPNLTSRQPYIFVDRLQSQDENIIATALVAGLAASLSEPEANGLGQYAMDNYPKETLKNFEMLLYMRSALPKLKGGDVSFSYQTLQKSGSKTLKNDDVFRLELSREELTAIRFTNVKGRIGLVSLFEKESTPQEARKDTTIGVSRTYSVDGRQTTEFREGDLVRIDFTPTFAPGSLEGSYQVVDYLPSGLRAVTDIQTTPFRQDGQYQRYPSSIEDQKVTFLIWKNFPRPFFYYARVVSKGDYKAEPALIQSLKSAESSNISTEAHITIK
ncbi:MAG: polymorphic toxin-type HINT domain-containing protein, partial [Patescibacteria group bacterium]|nr:polymorphic toxin-type HINT domain-containing protein [Patescibacteria group bacterium]